AYAGQRLAIQAASAWARPSSADGGGGGGGSGSASGTTGHGGVAAARINAGKSGEIGGRVGWAARSPTTAAAAASAATAGRRAPAPAPSVVAGAGGRAKSGAEWVLSKHAGWMVSNSAIAGGCSRAAEGRCNRLGFQ
ncbi:unnamed protein product, partial [Ectocarpus fasciculatus]